MTESYDKPAGGAGQSNAGEAVGSEGSGEPTPHVAGSASSRAGGNTQTKSASKMPPADATPPQQQTPASGEKSS
jgi:hypothetical protein